MDIKVESIKQLNDIIYTSIISDNNCTIEMRYINYSCFLTSSDLNNNKILLSICIKNKSIGNAFNKSDTRGIIRWIQDNCNLITKDIPLNDFTIKINKDDIKIDNHIEDIEVDFDPEGYYDASEYIDNYLDKHNRIRILQTPKGIKDKNDAYKLFEMFLNNNGCNKLIFSFSTYISHLNHIFVLDLVLDKMYTFGREVIAFTHVRPDMGDITFTSPYDEIVASGNFDELLLTFEEKYNICYKRCQVVCDYNDSVKINTYSNYNFNSYK